MMLTNSAVESGWGATIRGALRLATFLTLILVMTPIHILARLSRHSDPFLIPCLFYKMLARMMALQVRTHGLMAESTPTSPILFVSNHSSYLDVPVLGSVIPAAFVAKSEVASWPLIGTLAKLQHTVFIARQVGRMVEQRNEMRERLEQGQSLILFPEGTSSDGARTLPFKSSLFNIVETPLANGTFVTVQPVTTLCTELGGLPIGRAWRPYYAWYGDMTFMRHLWNVFKLGHFTIDVIFHPTVTIREFDNRKDMASYCQHMVAKGVEQCITGRFYVNQSALTPATTQKLLAAPAEDLAEPNV